MYDIQIRRHFNSVEDRIVLKTGLRNLDEAREARVLSGDLVVHAGTNNIVKSDEWLWDWEKVVPLRKNMHKSFALRAVESNGRQ